jgi:hypothetical protein
MQLATLVQSIQIHEPRDVIEMAQNYASAMRPTYSKYLSEMIWVIAPVLQVHAHLAVSHRNPTPQSPLSL